MHENQKKESGISYGEHVEVFPNLSDTASVTECTGLMPTPPKTPAEYESYQELHGMEVPKKLPGKRSIKSGIYDDRPEDVYF